jgi:hypothetical protein
MRVLFIVGKKKLCGSLKIWNFVNCNFWLFRLKRLPTPGLGEWEVENEMKITPDNSKVTRFTWARMKDRLRDYFRDQLIPEANSFKYLCRHTSCTLNATKSMGRPSFNSVYTQAGKYRAVCWDPNTEWQFSALNRVQRRAVKVANHTNESGWEIWTQLRMIARLCAHYKAHIWRPAWKAIGDTLLKPCYLSRGIHGMKTRIRKQRTDIGKYFFVNRTTEDWNRSSACVLSSFPCKYFYK